MDHWQFLAPLADKMSFMNITLRGYACKHYMWGLHMGLVPLIIFLTYWPMRQ